MSITSIKKNPDLPVTPVPIDMGNLKNPSGVKLDPKPESGVPLTYSPPSTDEPKKINPPFVADLGNLNTEEVTYHVDPRNVALRLLEGLV